MKWQLAIASCITACGTDATGTDPDTAPVASVDRFSDAFGKLFKRSAPIFDPANVKPNVPAPNAPIDLDAMFTVRALGPTGEATTYYSLDILPRAPSKAYIILRNGEQIGLPIIDSLPGDTGYNDFARVSEVSVDDDHVANQLTSFAETPRSPRAMPPSWTPIASSTGPRCRRARPGA
jgi:hypothetical protein